jgi:hypothetical protein
MDAGMAVLHPSMPDTRWWSYRTKVLLVCPRGGGRVGAIRTMLSKLLIASCLMALCVAIHATGLTMGIRWMKRHATPIEGQIWTATWILIRVAGWTLLLHLLQIAVWAFFYTWKGGMPDLTSAFYFSAVTYTTTG